MENKFVYIGRNILSEGLKTNTIYNGLPEEKISNLSKIFKLIKKLFVPVSQLAAAQSQLNVKGTPFFIANEEIKKGGNK